MNKIFTLTLILILSLTLGCSKQTEINPTSISTPTEMYNFLQEKGIHDVSLGEIEGAMNSPAKSNRNCYVVTDLLSFLIEYGLEEPDLIPTVPNDWFQDANCNVAKWTADVKERNPLDSTAINTNAPVYNITWTLDSTDVINTGNSFILPFYTYMVDSLGNIVINPECPGVFQPSCDGYHNVILEMTWNSSVYKRVGTAYGQANGTPDVILDCIGVDYLASDLSTFDFVAWAPLKFTPYEFLTESGLQWDLDGNHIVNSQDLLLFLLNWCEP